MPSFSNDNSVVISEATNLLINGMKANEDQSVASSGPDRRKILLQRKESLKALRNAVTPKNSPLLTTRKTLSKHESSTSSQIQRKLSDILSPSRKPNPRSNAAFVTNGDESSKVTVISRPTNGIQDDSVVPSSQTGVAGKYFDSRVKSLCNSTSTLINQEAVGHPSLHQTFKSLERLPMSDSQPDVNAFRLSPIHDTGATPSRPGDVSTSRNNSRSEMESLEWDPESQNVDGVSNLSIQAPNSGQQASSKKLILTSADTRPPPPSYHTHMQNKSAKLQLSPSNQPLTLPGDSLRDNGHEPHLAASHRKANSFDNLLDVVAETSQQLNQSSLLHTAPQTPFTHPVTNGSVTKDIPTSERRRSMFSVCLNKGAEALGFMVKAAKNEKNEDVGLTVQDLQPGGLAER